MAERLDEVEAILQGEGTHEEKVEKALLMLSRKMTRIQRVNENGIKDAKMGNNVIFSSLERLIKDTNAEVKIIYESLFYPDRLASVSQRDKAAKLRKKLGAEIVGDR